MEIRNILENDLERCSILLQEAYSDEPYNENFEKGNALKYIQGKFKDCREYSFVAIEGNIVIGFVFANLSQWADGPQAIMEEIVVDKKYRGKGVAQELNKNLEDNFKKLGIRSAMLWVKIDSPAHKFHIKNGYFNGDDVTVMFKDFK